VLHPDLIKAPKEDSGEVNLVDSDDDINSDSHSYSQSLANLQEPNNGVSLMTFSEVWRLQNHTGMLDLFWDHQIARSYQSMRTYWVGVLYSKNDNYYGSNVHGASFRCQQCFTNFFDMCQEKGTETVCPVCRTPTDGVSLCTDLL
jgi:hypothetical protein